jgi:hypothetical protein
MRWVMEGITFMKKFRDIGKTEKRIYEFWVQNSYVNEIGNWF